MIVFDLDDTLYKEQAYVSSGREAVRRHMREHGLSGDIDGPWSPEMLQAYRCHEPRLSLDKDTLQTLETLKGRAVMMGIITDGRAISQRHKYRALGLERYIDEADLSISELTGHDKHEAQPFEAMMRRHPQEEVWVYVGDNPAKDFAQPNRLGWTTVMLRDSSGANIHPQTLPEEAQGRPQHIIDRLSQLLELPEASPESHDTSIHHP